MLLTNNFIVVKIDRVYHCNLAFSKGESLGGLQQIIQLSQLLRKSNACLMRQLCAESTRYFIGENERLFLEKI